MAANSSASLDKWREYFRGANSDIFGIIEHAIMVAASDCPYDFKLRRDRIAEMLFTCKTTMCFGCDRIELALPNSTGVEKSDDKYKSGIEAGGSKDTKESKATSSRDDDHIEALGMNGNNQDSSNYSFEDAEALTNEIEEEFQYFGEVLRIKETLDNSEEEPDTLLFDSLRKLQLMPLSIDTLKETEIGKSVNTLRKHRSKDVRNVARALIEEWKVMVDAWTEATAAIAVAEVTPESVKPCAVKDADDEGLPSPPLDEGAFFATPVSMDLSQIFDGMDDDGNPRNSGEFNKNRDNGRSAKRNVPKWKLETPPIKDKKPTVPKIRQEAMSPPRSKPNRHSGSDAFGKYPPSGESGPGRPKSSIHPKSNNNIKTGQRVDRGPIQKKPAPYQQEKLVCDNASSVRTKLEAAKRKLQERYQEAENAKKQRTIQVVDLQDLPKQNILQRNQNMRGGNHNRHRVNGHH